jgi:Raf kinase inhibitor-like YbhB/YbcL family protein
MRRLLVLVALVLAVAACGGDDDEAVSTTSGPSSQPAEATGFAFTGGDVADGRAIDPTYTCDGDNVSPALEWQDVPASAVELVLVVDDPDAGGDGFTHWVAYGIAPDQTSLEAGVPVAPVVSGAINLMQSPNDGGGYGWTGPCPPGGETHHYVFTLYALDEATGLDGGADPTDVLAATEGHSLGEATLTATYSH